MILGTILIAYVIVFLEITHRALAEDNDHG